MAVPIVFIDIAGPDLRAQSAFYGKVFDWEIDPEGHFRVPAVTPMPGVLRTDPAETVIYLGVPDVAATLELVEANGGTVIARRFEVPGVVVLGLFADPAGNRLGLVEMERSGDRRVIPGGPRDSE
ncbi:MAG TPA: VOC family protein [Longimicrobium sp.]|nr:VOC family protein [Longimicrobium sp.]